MTFSVSSAMKRNSDDGDDLLVLKKITFFHFIVITDCTMVFFYLYRDNSVYNTSDWRVNLGSPFHVIIQCKM